MSTGKTIGATVNNDVTSREMREAQAKAKIEEAKRRARENYYNNEVSKQHEKYSKLNQELDEAKAKYADLTYQLPSLGNIDAHADIESMKSWVSTSKATLKEMKQQLDIEIHQAHKRHLARIKKAETWEKVHSHHKEAISIHDVIVQIADEYKQISAINKITVPSVPTLPLENATQQELDTALAHLQQQIIKLQKQLQVAENQLFTQQNVKSQSGEQVQAIKANDRLQAQKIAEQQQTRQELTDYARQQAQQIGIDIPNYIKIITEHYMGDKVNIKRTKEEISKILLKEKELIRCNQQAMQMLANPPANETGNIELAKRWQGLHNSLIKVTQKHRHNISNFNKLERIYKHLQELNQRLVNDAYIQANLEEELSKVGLNIVTTTTGATIFGDTDDVLVEVEPVQTDKGVVLKTQQVFADNLNSRQITQHSAEMCKKLKKAVHSAKDEKSQHDINSAIKPSADDGKVIQRKREYIHRQRQMAMG